MSRAVLLFLLIRGGMIQEKDSRAPIPEAGARKEAQKLIRSVFKEEFSKSAPADRQSLARKLLSQALETRDDLPAQYELLQESRGLAAEAGDVHTAIRAVEELSSRFRVDALGLKYTAIATASLRAKQPEELSQAAIALLSLADEALAIQEVDTAERACTSAQGFARAAKSLPLLGRADAKAKEIAAFKAASAGYLKAKEALAKNPADAEANLQVGRHLCLLKGDWTAGLPYLARSSDAGLKTAASKDLASPAGATEQLALADLWWDLSEKESGTEKTAFRRRAAAWYAAAAPRLTGLSKVKADKRLEAVPDAGGPPAARRVNLLELVDPRRDAVAGAWELKGSALVSPTLLAFAQLQIPYRPPQEYDLELVIEHLGDAHSIDIGLAAGDRQFTVVLDGWDATVTGFHVLDGHPSPIDETAYRKRIFADEKPRKVVCSVRKAAVSLLIDGKTILDWRGDLKRLSNHSAWHIPDKSTLFIGSWTSYRITKMELLSVTGEGSRLR
jgi:hypothetical protein